MIRNRSSIAWAACAWLALGAVGRPDDPPPKPEDKPSKVASPTPIQLARISKTARRIVPSVFTVGRPDNSGAAAFLISRKHRLLATAAHVAGYYQEGEGPILAIPDGTATTYRVEQVYYHPGTVRELDGGFYARSDDPEDGPVDSRHGPDVAVFRLAEGGPDLPDELELATTEELQLLDGRALGLLGYPGDRADGWPTARRPAWATLGSGLFRSTADEDRSGLLFPVQQRVVLAASLEGGSSGGPLFLDNGHVAGIISGGACKVEETWDTMCTRVDALRELLRCHRLLGLEPDPGAPASLQADWTNDPRLPRLRDAVRKIRDARKRRNEGNYQVAGRLCNEVIEAFPGYAFAVLERSWVYSDYSDEHWDRLSPEERARFGRWAFDDSTRCVKANTNRALPILIALRNDLLVGRSLSKRDVFEKVIAGVDWTIEVWPLAESETALAHHLRARAHHYLGNLEGAESDYAESIRLEPEEPRWRLARAKLYDERGKAALAAEDRRKSEELRAAKGGPSANPNSARSPFDLSEPSRSRLDRGS